MNMGNENKDNICFKQILREKDNNDFDIIFSLLNTEKINSIDDFKTIRNFLTNHSNPIREALALKLEDFIKREEIEMTYFISSFLEDMK